MGFEQKLAAQARSAKVSVTAEPYFSRVTGLRVIRFVGWGEDSPQSWLGIRLVQPWASPRWKVGDAYEISELIRFCKSRGEKAVVYLTHAAKPEAEFGLLDAEVALGLAIQRISKKYEKVLARASSSNEAERARDDLEWWLSEVATFQ